MVDSEKRRPVVSPKGDSIADIKAPLEFKVFAREDLSQYPLILDSVQSSCTPSQISLAPAEDLPDVLESVEGRRSCRTSSVRSLQVNLGMEKYYPKL